MSRFITTLMALVLLSTPFTEVLSQEDISEVPVIFEALEEVIDIESPIDFFCGINPPDSSVSAAILPTHDAVVSGTDVTFLGELYNQNNFPVTGTLYARVFRNPTESESTLHSAVDQFVVEEGITLPANGQAPIEYTWDIPTFLPAGDYYVSYYFVTNEGFELMGISGAESQIGSFSSLTVASEISEVPAFVKSETRVNGQTYDFNTALKVSGTENREVSVVVSNPTDEAVTLPLQWQQAEGTIVLEERNKYTKTELITLEPKERRTLTYTIQEQVHPLIVVSVKLDFKGTGSIINVLVEQDSLQKSVLTSAVLVALPDRLEVYGCIEFLGGTASSSKIDITIVDKNENVLGSYTFANFEDNVLAVREQIALPENLNSATLRFTVEAYGMPSMQEEIEFDFGGGAETDESFGDGATSLADRILNDPVMFYGGSLILLLLLFLISSVHKRHIKNEDIVDDTFNTAGGGKMLLLALLIGVSSFFSSASEANAQSVSCTPSAPTTRGVVLNSIPTINNTAWFNIFGQQ